MYSALLVDQVNASSDVVFMSVMASWGHHSYHFSLFVEAVHFACTARRVLTLSHTHSRNKVPPFATSTNICRRMIFKPCFGLARKRVVAEKTGIAGAKTRFVAKAAGELAEEVLGVNKEQHIDISSDGDEAISNVEEKEVESDVTEAKAEGEDEQFDVHLTLSRPEIWNDVSPSHSNQKQTREKEFGIWMLSTGKNVGEVVQKARKAVPDKAHSTSPLYWGILDVTDMDPVLEGFFNPTEWAEIVADFHEDVRLEDVHDDVRQSIHSVMDKIAETVARENTSNVVDAIEKVSFPSTRLNEVR
ncbi:hypothetical protein BC832DRAFT_118577 [Gaertneriomyces semiglobifer]|nr:hypothetical protein BC832DRAFT_118577 [Gaertneriomyces semiglobifer]